MEICEGNTSEALTKFFKIILLFFHGQADVERSFSFNKDFLVENLQEDSLIAQRCVHNFVKKHKKIQDIEITKNMITAFKCASSGRVEALKNKREQEELSKKRKRELGFEIQALKSKKREAEETINAARQEILAYDNTLKKLEEIKR